MINAVLDIKLLAPDEWYVLRSTRLRALRESPRAFTSHYLIEARWHEGEYGARPDSHRALDRRHRHGPRHRHRRLGERACAIRATTRGVDLGRADAPPERRLPLPRRRAGRRRTQAETRRAAALGAGGQRRRPTRLHPARVPTDRRPAARPGPQALGGAPEPAPLTVSGARLAN